MTEEELFEKFQKNEMPKGYIPKENCLFFITEAIRNNFTILGIEGFRIKDDKIIPNLDEIFDFSNASTKEMNKIITEVLYPFFSTVANSEVYDFTIDKDISHNHHKGFLYRVPRKGTS